MRDDRPRFHVGKYDTIPSAKPVVTTCRLHRSIDRSINRWSTILLSRGGEVYKYQRVRERAAQATATQRLPLAVGFTARANLPPMVHRVRSGHTLE